MPQDGLVGRPWLTLAPWLRQIFLCCEAWGPEGRTTMDRKEHWERVYETKATDAVSWFQETPTVSARLLQSAGLGPAT